MLRVLFVAPMFGSEVKGGPALRTAITLRALSRIFEVSVLVWSKKQLGSCDENQLLISYPECKRVFIKDRTEETNYLLRLNSKLNGKNKKLLSLLTLLEAKLLFGDALRQWKLNRDKAEFVKQIALDHNYKIIWWSFANLESRAVLLFNRKVSHLQIDTVADTDSVWSRFILRSLPFIPLHSKVFTAFKGWRKRQDEKNLIRTSKILTAVSEVDKLYYSSISHSNCSIMVFRNAITIKNYEVSAPSAFLGNGSSRRGVLLMGSFGRKHSPMDFGAKWFIESTWPKIKKVVKDAELHIVGIGSEQFQQSDITQGIVVHGSVDSILPFVSICKVSVVPLFFESGTRFKILEAAALGLLTVTTSLGNEGLEFVDKKDLFVADSSEKFATCVVQGLTEKKCDVMIENSKDTLTHMYTFENLLEDIEKIAKQLNGANV
jgi:hypothetical protein